MELSKEDRDIAQRFINCCYDDNLKMPSEDEMQRLLRIGLVEKLPNGYYHEMPMMRELGF